VPPTAVWILVALAAIVVAAAVPALIQLRRTLQMAERTLDTTGKRLEETLTKLAATLERVDRASAELERSVYRISGLLETLGTVGDGLAKVRGTFTTAAAVGTSLAQFVLGALTTSFRRRRARRRQQDGDPRPADSSRTPHEESIR